MKLVRIIPYYIEETHPAKKLIDLNGYYIDKSELIIGLIDKPNEVTLFSRPRRFGKTLNVSMLKYFFEITEGRQLEIEKEDANGRYKRLV